MTPKPNTSKTVRQEFIWPVGLRRKLERIAKRERRSLSQMSIILMEKALATFEEGKQ